MIVKRKEKVMIVIVRWSKRRKSKLLKMKASIVTIGTVKTVKTFFFAFPALNSTAMNKKLKYSISYPIINDFSQKKSKLLKKQISPSHSHSHSEMMKHIMFDHLTNQGGYLKDNKWTCETDSQSLQLCNLKMPEPFLRLGRNLWGLESVYCDDRHNRRIPFYSTSVLS